MTPEIQPPLPPGLAIQIVINGDKTSINFIPRSAADGGPATIAGEHGSATGRHTVQAGLQSAPVRALGQSPKKSWWERLRERGIVVTIATIITAIATVIGTAVAICVWIGWTP